MSMTGIKRNAARQSSSTTERGAMYEQLALERLVASGLRPLAKNYRAAGSEIDLILQSEAGCIVFVEVRARNTLRYGGAAGSVDLRKRVRLRRAAAAWLMRFGAHPPRCRFDVVAIESGRVNWIKDAISLEEV